MSLRPASARWFELLTARDSLTISVEALARTGSVELETHSETHARINLPDLQERMAEYNRLARRYHTYWPACELHPASAPGMPDRMLGRALARLERWADSVEPLVQLLESMRAERAELLLLEEMLGVDTEGKLDYSLLSTAGPSLEVRLFVLPAGYRLTAMPASLLYCKCSSPAHDFLLAVGQPADFLVELPVGDVAIVGGIIALPDDGCLVPAAFQVPIQTVGRSIERAVLEPADVDVVPGERDILDLGVGLDPVDALAFASPEAFGILDGFLVHRVVFGALSVGIRGHLLVRPIHAVMLVQHSFLRLSFCRAPIAVPAR